MTGGSIQRLNAGIRSKRRKERLKASSRMPITSRRPLLCSTTLRQACDDVGDRYCSKSYTLLLPAMAGVGAQLHLQEVRLRNTRIDQIERLHLCFHH